MCGQISSYHVENLNSNGITWGYMEFHYIIIMKGIDFDRMNQSVYPNIAEELRVAIPPHSFTASLHYHVESAAP